MDAGTVALLLGAGLLGGAMNAIAGGATLITFPAMLAAGLPPVTAAASNALAVSPGHLFGALADRAQLPPLRRLTAPLIAAAGGGAIGAAGLLLTPERAFLMLVPPLLGAATLIFAFGPVMQRRSAARHDAARRNRARGALLAGSSVYGGYFGAGLGVMLLAALALTGEESLRAANALKNLLATMVSAASIAIFAVQGAIAWPQTLVMLAGAVAGGLAGGRLNAVLPARLVRAAITLIGAAMTAIYAARIWF